MVSSPNRFFIALMPPPEMQDYADGIKRYFIDCYGSRGAQKSPPHITLQPPFEWSTQNVPALEECVSIFAQGQGSVPITLSGFGAFAPRVIYVNVVRTQELLTLQADLMAHLEARLGISDPVSQTRPFVPHMTVAFRDLTQQNFKAAWPKFQQRQLQFEFTATELTLLLHDGKRWNVSTEFPLKRTIVNR